MPRGSTLGRYVKGHCDPARGLLHGQGHQQEAESACRHTSCDLYQLDFSAWSAQKAMERRQRPELHVNSEQRDLLEEARGDLGEEHES